MVAIYARQSVDKKDSISIEGQIELCKKECPNQKPRIYTDKGYSGKNTERPAFQHMIAAVKCDEIDKILVYRLDRISRSISDFGRIWETLKQHGAEFVSVSEKFDTSTPMGRAMVYIIMVFAQLECETIAERVRDNYYQRAKRGAWMGGPAAFGFDLKRTVIGGKKATTFVANKDIEIVKKIFHSYAYMNLSLGKIAAHLTAANIPGIQRKTWDNVSIARILHNPSYVKADADVYYYYERKGLVIYNDISEFTGEKGLLLCGKRDCATNKYTNLQNQLLALSAHNGVVDSTTFLACQRKLDENRQLKNTGAGKYTWLSGLLKCAACGYSLRVNSTNGGKYLYFSCSGKTNLHLCNLKHTEKIKDVEREAACQIQAEIDRLSSSKNKKAEPVSMSDLHNDEKIELAKINNQISNLMDKMEEANDISMRYINDRIGKLDSRRKQLLEIINSAPKQTPFKFSGCNFAALNFYEKKAVAKAIVRRVEVSPDSVTVFYK